MHKRNDLNFVLLKKYPGHFNLLLHNKSENIFDLNYIYYVYFLFKIIIYDCIIIINHNKNYKLSKLFYFFNKIEYITLKSSIYTYIMYL